MTYLITFYAKVEDFPALGNIKFSDSNLTILREKGTKKILGCKQKYLTDIVIIPLKMRILNVLSKEGHLKNAQNFETIDLRRSPPARHKNMHLPWKCRV